MIPLGDRGASNIPRRQRVAAVWKWVFLASTLVGAVLLAFLLADVLRKGLPWFDHQFLTSYPSRFPAKAGVKAALWGTIWLILMTAAIAIPVGVGAAVYLEEFAKKTRLNTFIEINIANLAGVPSIVYGILGLALFVRGVGLGRSLLAGALTMSLLILPVIIIAAREALKAVPNALRQAAMALGATRWQMVWHHSLPAAAPGILTGIILALSRAMGEAAPLIMLGALTYVAFTPAGPMDAFTALPIQIFNWASRPQADFQNVAAAGIILLLAVLLSMNAVAVLLRIRFEKGRKW